MTEINVRGVWGGTVGKEQGNNSADGYSKGNRKTETPKSEPLSCGIVVSGGSDTQRGIVNAAAKAGFGQFLGPSVTKIMVGDVWGNTVGKEN